MFHGEEGISIRGIIDNDYTLGIPVVGTRQSPESFCTKQQVELPSPLLLGEQSRQITPSKHLTMSREANKV